MIRLLQRSTRFLNVLIIVSLLVGLIPPGALTPGGVRVAQAQEPTETPTDTPTTAEPTPTEAPTPALSPTNGPTETPMDTPTEAPTPTEEPTPTETPALSPTNGPTATEGPAPTEGPTPTETATEVAVDTPTPSPVPTETATPALSPTNGLTITPPPPLTVTPTATLEMDQLSLELIADPITVAPNQGVTVSLRLANLGQTSLDDVSLTALLPPDLQYQAPLGELIPQYDPRIRLLAWHLTRLAPERAVQLGYRAQVVSGASPGSLILAAQAQVAGWEEPLQARAMITVEAAIEPTPLEEMFEIPVAGPAAKIRLAVQPMGREAGQHQFWLAVHVVDADGLAVADGTEVQLSVQNGQVGRDTLQTKDGMALTHLRVRPDEVATVTAVAGAAQNTLPVGGEATDEDAVLGELLPQVRRARAGYGDETLARIAARNAVQAEGDEVAAENRTRRVAFRQATRRLTFIQKTQEQGEQNQALTFQLMDVRIGRESLLPAQGELRTSGHWMAYWPAGQPWQMIYEVGDASVEQFFVFEEGTPVDGDLVIEGHFTTALRPVLLSDEEGVLFKAPNARWDDEAEERDLAYGPALVEDARGQSLFARMELQGRRLRLSIPAQWLARAEFPLVVDPLIGPAELVSGLQGEARDPAIAYDGTNFLTVWDWNGDVYGQRVDANGELAGDLIVISQVEGSQRRADVVYNPVSGEYLVVWADDRYGWPYYAVYAQRVSTTGALIGDEIQVAPPLHYLGYFGGAKVAVSEGGDYLIVWSHHNSSSGYDIYGQMLDQNGNLVGDMIAINGTAPEYQRYSDVAYDDQTDIFLVVWADTYGGNVYGQRLDANGTLLGNNRTLVDTSGQDVYHSPSIASNDNGQFLVTWSQEMSSSDYDVFAVRVAAATGDVEGSIINVDTSGSRDRDPAVTAISSSEYLVAWTENGYRINLRRVGSDGSLPGTPLADIDQGYYSAVAYGGGQSLAVWEDHDTAGQEIITGQRISNDDATIGDLIYVSPYFTVREYVDLAYQAQTGEVLLSWDQAYASPNEDVFVQRVNEQGQPVGDPVNLTDDPDADQWRPRIAAGTNGYLAVWQDERNQSTTGLDIYGHLLDATGNLSGTFFAISNAIGDQWSADVVYNSQQDEYLVAWEDGRDPADRQIFYQIVGGDGSPKLASEGSIPADSDQGCPRMTYNPQRDEYLVVFWDSRSGNQGIDIYGQVIDADGSLTGASYPVMTAPTDQYGGFVAYSPSGDVYLAVWEDHRDGWSDYDVYGQVISGDGTSLMGGEFFIASASANQRYPDVVARSSDQTDEFVVVWQDRRNDSDRDIYLQRVDAGGNLLDEPDTAADETDPTVNLPVAVDSVNYYERPAVTYNPDDDVYLLAWSNRDDGGVYVQRYTPSMPDAPVASFEADPTTGPVPLAAVFTDTSTGQIGDREWDFGDGSDPLSTTDLSVEHTYTSTGTFTVTLTVSNPGGSDAASGVIAVSEQTTPTLDEDFEDFTIDEDPLYWLDQTSSTSGSDQFEVMYLAGNKVYGSDYEGSSRYSTYAIPGWQAWQNYEYVGWLRITDAADGEGGITFYSRYPAYEQKRYELNSWEATADNFGFRATGTSLTGDVDTGVLALPDTWYHFRVQVATHPDRTTLRAKVWPAGEAEPVEWQAVAEDDSPTRLTAGAAGVRTWGAGTRYFDDLVVAPLGIQSDFRAAERTGATPHQVTFVAEPIGQVITYTWDFGDGSELLMTNVPTATHTYNEVGTYDVSLTVEGPGGSDILTRANYITVTETPPVDLPSPWQHQDVGSVGQAGDASYSDGTFTVDGGGADIWGTADEFHYVYQTLEGDGEIVARVVSVENTDSWAKAGVMIRETLNANSRHVFMALTPVNGLAFQRRTSTGGSSSHTSGGSASAPHWVRLVRTGNTFTGYVSSGGSSWTEVDSVDISMANNVYIGLAVTAHDDSTLCTAEFDNVNASEAVVADFAAEPLTGTVPLVVTFTDESTGTVDSRLWDFGDGSTPLTTSGVTATHTYTATGVYTVALTVSGPQGSDTLTRTNCITVTQPTTPSALVWWDDDFFFRRPLTVTVSQPLTYSPGVTTPLGLELDTAALVNEGKLRGDGHDLRVAYWDGLAWQELPRSVQGMGSPTSTVIFPLRATITDTDEGYWLYYGQAVASEPPLLSEAVPEEATVTPGPEETAAVTVTIHAASGGELLSADGRTRVTFPPGAVAETVLASHSPYRAVYPQPSETLARFDLEAQTLGGQAVTAFSQPLTLTFDYSGLAVEPSVEDSMTLYR